ncbi:MAG: DUF2231 domain-containing protein [Haliscomenobacter sp.]
MPLFPDLRTPPLMGVLHPILVHFPIAFLLLAAGLQLAALHPATKKFEPFIPMLLILGSISSLLAVLTGLLLSRSGDYAEGAVRLHRNTGLALAVVSLALWWGGQQLPRYLRNIGFALLTLLVFFTGHQGGQLTHGPFSLSLPADAPTPTSVPADTSAYGRLVAPVLQEKCIACHGPNRQKGGLRLDSPEWARKGGKNGYMTAESPLSVHRMRLPLSDDKHMPPRQKKQLLPTELQHLEAWFEQQCPLNFNPRNTALLATNTTPEATYWPSATDLSAPPTAALAAIEQAGVVVLPIAQGNPMLEINFQHLPANTVIPWEALTQIRAHTVSVRLSGQALSAAHLRWLSGLPRLTRLYLDNSTVTEAGLSCLQHANQLKYLNLSGTSVGFVALSRLQLPQLQKLFIFQTPIRPDQVAGLKKHFPSAHLDTGAAVLPVLESDTVMLK